jgi:hypothetical protein
MHNILHYLATTLSRRVPLPVLNGFTFVRWGDVKQAAVGSCNSNLRLLPVEQGSRFVRWATHFC